MSTAVTPIPPRSARGPDQIGVPIPPMIRQAVSQLGLTPREADLAELLAIGCATSTVSETLGISEATIRTHLRKIFASHQISSRVELVALVLRQVLQDLEHPEKTQLLTS